MKYLDEYKDGAISKGISKKIKEISKKKIKIMEVCGTHTVAIFKNGIKDLIPENIELLSGPGCPVCVTHMGDIDKIIWLADREDVIIATYGDMIRVPGSKSSLQQKRANGADIRTVYSVAESLKIARENPNKEVVFFGIGFETTSPNAAVAVKMAYEETTVKNFSILSVHKLLPPALGALLNDPELNVDGFLCPGHASAIIGTEVYKGACEKYRRSFVVAGFEGLDILHSIYMIVKQLEDDNPSVEIQYSRVVKPQGNIRAKEVLNEVFEPTDSKWRGIGLLPQSGLAVRDKYAEFDALRKFDFPEMESEEPKGCICPDILRGIKRPTECKLFRNVCNPDNPVGACMVSFEGTCSAYFKYT